MGEAIISRRGGGVGINLKVISAASREQLPSNPTKYTVCVITSTPITSWQIGGEQPVSPEDGFVWFSELDTKLLTFNMLKKNGVYISPGSAQQYVSGTWNIVQVGIYDGTTWLGLRTYLYAQGDMMTDITGGWRASWLNAESAGTVTNKYNGTNGIDFYLYEKYEENGSVSKGFFSTSRPIDITHYNTINYKLYYFKRNSSSPSTLQAGYLEVGGRASVTTNTFLLDFGTKTTTALSSGVETTLSVDISSITGNYYIGLNLQAPAYRGTDILLLECSLE